MIERDPDIVQETIYTFPKYLEMASDLYLAKGAKVILSSATPDNPWETGTFTWVPNRFEYYPWQVLLSSPQSPLS